MIASYWTNIRIYQILFAVTIIISIIAITSTVTISSPVNNDRLALIIGNAAYTKSPTLIHPLPDTKKIHKALFLQDIKLFENKVHHNLDQEEMEGLFKRFAKAAKNKIALVYYAGHGVQYDSQSYLIPIGIDMTDEIKLKYHAVNISMLLDFLKDEKVKAGLLFLDTYRNNPFRGGGNRGLARAKGIKTEIIISYATAADDQVADENPYAEVLSELIGSKSDLPIEAVLKLLRKNVIQQTKGKQNPDYVSFFAKQNFCFAKCAERKKSIDIDAYYQEAIDWLDGTDQSQYRKAIRQLTWLAEDGHSDAMFRLGVVYYLGKGTRQNKAIGCGWIKDAADAENEQAEKQYNELPSCK